MISQILLIMSDEFVFELVKPFFSFNRKEIKDYCFKLYNQLKKMEQPPQILPNSKEFSPVTQEEKSPFDRIGDSIEKIPQVIEKGINRYFENSEHKQESKERIEIKRMENEKHESNIKAVILIAVLILSAVCYLVKGLDQQITAIICFILGYSVNGINGFINKKITSKAD